MHQQRNNEKGSVLIGVLVVLTIAAMVSAGYMGTAVREELGTQRLVNSNRAFYAAESGIEDVKWDMQLQFQPVFWASGWSEASFTWFDGVLANPATYNFPTNKALGNASYTVTIVDVSNAALGGRDVTLSSTGTSGGETRTVQAIVRFGLTPSTVFDYSYFVNNYGWFHGGGITANGSVRSNGNFSFQGNPRVNGDAYASINPALGAVGTISGTYASHTYSQYQQYYNGPGRQQTRPTNPTDASNPTGTYYEYGYDGTPENFQNEDENFNGVLDVGEDDNGDGALDLGQKELVMPYVGDLSLYKTLAAAKNGTITQGGQVLVNNIYESSGVGPDGIGGTPDDGSVVLIGTAQSPIVIDGPVVIEGDVLIKGVVTGQGTIYSQRNTHILGDITYANPPIWSKPDSDPDTTSAINQTKDMLGLVAKGNIVVGDYTRNDWKQNLLPYNQPPFTQKYDVDPTDEVNGYVSGTQANGILDYDEDVNGNGVLDAGEDKIRPYFHANYTSLDGGNKDGGSGNAVGRRYYESSLSDNWISQYAVSASSIRHIDAITYTNHLWTGKVGALKHFGTLIARNEAVVFSGSIDINYDPRLGLYGMEFIDIFLPRELDQPNTIGWRESIGALEYETPTY